LNNNDLVIKAEGCQQTK